MDQKFKEEIKTKIALLLLGNKIFVKKVYSLMFMMRVDI